MKKKIRNKSMTENCMDVMKEPPINISCHYQYIHFLIILDKSTNNNLNNTDIQPRAILDKS